ncbi:methyl-accepting chemotaxis protein [Halochromatium salexigens]|uniref:methyl-accepting chemotaxis protein n=1 Tax=Halochromatium salexigens TaxID=49447 RepID=UPI0019119317|nr:methyl-accepting chemotaxis protein [Halochromatium salexigens]
MIAIIALLGGIATLNMLAVKNKSVMLAEEYVPEVEVASRLRGAANRLMYAMRGYGLTGADNHWQEAEAEAALLDEALADATALNKTASHLSALSGQIATAQQARDTYVDLMEQTRQLTERFKANRQQLDDNAADYMQAANKFLELENALFEQALEERLAKVQAVNRIVELGSSARVANFQAQAMRQPALRQEAIEHLTAIAPEIDVIRPITRLQEDITQLDTIEQSAADYQAAIVAYGMEADKDFAANEQLLGQLRKAMDLEASRFVDASKAFLENQIEALATDMTNGHRAITLANQIVDLGNETRISAFKAQALNDLSYIEDALDTNMPKIQDLLTTLEDSVTDTALLDQIAATGSAATGYQTAMERLVENWNIRERLALERTDAGRQLITACKATADAGLENTQQIADDTKNTMTLSSLVVGIGLVVALVLGIVLAWLITRSIVGPINRVVKDLQDGSEQVATVSGHVNISSQQMAEGAGEQASSLEETSSSVEEMAAGTRQNAEHAREADTLSRTANDKADQGVKAARATAEEVRKRIEKLDTAIKAIEESTNSTAKVVSTIDGIAFQTNLLALNAAVEAARAGEQGKGFAVVADEVRKLAQRSAEEVKNTNELMKSAQDNAARIKDVSAELEKYLGKAVAEEMVSLFEETVHASTQVTQLMSEVATASDEQARGVEQINLAVSQMDKVTQISASNAEESSAASEELANQANQLKQIVADLRYLVDGVRTDDTGADSSGDEHAFSQHPPLLQQQSRQTHDEF